MISRETNRKKEKRKKEDKPLTILSGSVPGFPLPLIVTVLEEPPPPALLQHACLEHLSPKTREKPLLGLVLFRDHLNVVSRFEEQRVRVRDRRKHHGGDFMRRRSRRRRNCRRCGAQGGQPRGPHGCDLREIRALGEREEGRWRRRRRKRRRRW
ncbi:hypothetical protein TorRG33x02_189610 [Trema orientale]|uniref:Uncharacterized protein n=1 Tax=Trema orientale TaxID=63057 RepID=A0A2P5EIF0_TREOI|nr:hypothetical protein TorRG33x02_189610 [Trema orientale]